MAEYSLSADAILKREHDEFIALCEALDVPVYKAGAIALHGAFRAGEGLAVAKAMRALVQQNPSKGASMGETPSPA